MKTSTNNFNEFKKNELYILETENLRRLVKFVKYFDNTSAGYAVLTLEFLILQDLSNARKEVEGLTLNMSSDRFYRKYKAKYYGDKTTHPEEYV